MSLQLREQLNSTRDIRQVRAARCLFAFALALGACTDQSSSELRLPAPTGDFAVGTQARRLTDVTRPENATPDPDDHRSIVLQIWYPADPRAEGPPAPWLEPEVGDSLLPGLLPVGWSAMVETNSKVGVPLVPGEAPLPVVIASHGFATPRNLYVTLYEELASHGFVVASIEHAHDSLLTIFPDDGEHVTLDSAFAQAFEAVPQSPTPADIEALMAFADGYISLWVEDAGFALDQLALFNGDDPEGLLTGRLEVTAVGMFGHSFGGAAAAEACGTDPRFVVCMNLDGAFFGPERPHGGRAIAQPFMTMLTADHLAGDSTPADIFDRLLGAGYQLEIASITHGGFSDSRAALERIAGLDTVDMNAIDVESLDESFGTLGGDPAVEIMRAYTLALFEEHLAGETQDLLGGPSPDFPEVKFTSR